MKKKWIIPTVVVLLLLFVPIPTGTYKDGGTKEFTALTYKIVAWNRPVDASRGAYSKIRVYPFPQNFKSIDSLWDSEQKGMENDAEKPDDTHSHTDSAQPQTVEHDEVGYCGNTVTTIYIDGEKYSFWGSESVYLTDLLRYLDYIPDNTCKCRPEYQVDTEFGEGYGISLSEKYVRVGTAQANLTREQAEEIEKIINDAEKEKLEMQ